MENEKKFARTLVTTALPYANGPPIAVYVLAHLRDRKWRKAFNIWVLLFVIFLIAALIISFKLKQGFFNPWLPDPPITE